MTYKSNDSNITGKCEYWIHLNETLKARGLHRRTLWQIQLDADYW